MSGTTVATITYGANNVVTLYLDHKFSRAKVNVSSRSEMPYDIVALNDVTIPGYLANFDPEENTVIQRLTAIEQKIAFPTPVTSVNRLAPGGSTEATARVVYTAGEPVTKVKFGTITVDKAGTNVSSNDLTATFDKKLLPGYSYTLEVNIGPSNIIVDDPPAGFIPFVGAFWKADQTGERLIRIGRATSGEADGLWTAQVVVGDDWIVLDRTRPAPAANVWTANPTMSGNDTGFDAAYAVTGDIKYLEGTLRASGSTGFQQYDDEIYFRIGLKGTYTPTVYAPARYGLVLLTYKNNTKQHAIWIRQGEEADYLMRPGDPNETGTGWGTPNRPAALAFSPYNTTYTFNTMVPLNQGQFTDYPTKPGALFQWSSGSSLRVAHAPLGSAGSWNNGYPSGGNDYWMGPNYLAGTHESCPPGYVRPDDGIISGPNPAGLVGAAGDAAGSGMRQSLWLTPQVAMGGNVDNSSWGYYADGYFDRRAINGGNSVGTTAANIAYIGRIFYNQTSNASLFFPASGYRTDGAGVNSAGITGLYWSSSSPNRDRAWHLRFNASNAFMNDVDHTRGYGYNIRCVKRKSVIISAHIMTATPFGTITSPVEFAKTSIERSDLDALITLTNTTNYSIVDWYTSDNPAGTKATFPITSNTILYVRLNGDGSSADAPDCFATADELADFAARVNAGTEPADLYYWLIADIDLSDCSRNNEWGSAGWMPIGNAGSPFTGSFNGKGHTISNLQINRAAPGVVDLGLFGSINNGKIDSLKVELGGNINGGAGTQVGGLAGYVSGSGSVISNCSVTGSGSIGNSSAIGGVAGHIGSGATVTGCYASVNITGSNSLGGIVGRVGEDINNRGFVDNCYSTGYVSGGGSNIGGVVGQLVHGSVANCYATGAVNGYSTSSSSNCGGIVGSVNSTAARVNNCVALNASVTASAGTVVGRIMGGNTISSVTLTNNWARNMTITNGNGPKTNLNNTGNGYDGADITPAGSEMSADWWETASPSGPGWNNNIWHFEDGQLPKLKWQ